MLNKINVCNHNNETYEDIEYKSVTKQAENKYKTYIIKRKVVERKPFI